MGRTNSNQQNPNRYYSSGHHSHSNNYQHGHHNQASSSRQASDSLPAFSNQQAQLMMTPQINFADQLQQIQQPLYYQQQQILPILPPFEQPNYQMINFNQKPLAPNWTDNFANMYQVTAQPLQMPINPLAACPNANLQAFPPNQVTDTGIIPTSPYYELPAGIMVPLIEKNGSKDYKPLEPDDLRLPLPKFPDEKFLRAIDSYYGNDGKLRDNDGWNKEFIDSIKTK